MIYGKYANAKLFATYIDDSAIDEILSMLDDELLEECRVAIMPDVCYADTHSVVGYVQTTNGRIDPRTISGDIGCGITLWKTNVKADSIDLAYADKKIREAITEISNKIYVSYSDVAWEISSLPIFRLADEYLDDVLDKIKLRKETFVGQLYTIGNGNHYIELGIDYDRNLTIAIHSGSRAFGGAIHKYFMNKLKQKDFDKEAFTAGIKEIKSKYSGEKIAEKIAELKKSLTTEQKSYLYKPEDIALYKEYMELAVEYARLNRYIIADKIADILGVHLFERIESIHNYLGTGGIIRKGAISSYLNEKIIIALNMADGMAICKGKGNPDWLYSAPHGLGRLFSRTKAKETLSMDDFKKDMSNVYSSSVNESIIDESPKAYKPLDAVLPLIGGTCDIIEIIKPILNIKY